MSTSRGIVILDDEETLTWAMAQVLAEADQGFKVHAAMDSEEAFRLLDDDIALLIFEPTLPGFDGFELIRTLQRRYPAIKLIVMSSYFDSDTEAKLDQLGCKLRLEKPFCLDEMLKLVREALGSA